MLQDQSFKHRALVVEDDEVSRLVVCKMLDHLGLCTDAVTDGSQAVEKATRVRYQIIFMDLMMPIMGGREAMKSIRRSELERWVNPKPIFAMSTSITSAEIPGLMSMGFSGALVKPIRLNDVRRVLLCAGLLNVPDSISPISEADGC